MEMVLKRELFDGIQWLPCVKPLREETRTFLKLGQREVLFGHQSPLPPLRAVNCGAYSRVVTESLSTHQGFLCRIDTTSTVVF